MKTSSPSRASSRSTAPSFSFAAHGDLSSIQLTSEPALARVVYDILRALAYLHDDAGIIHRDLKPENLLRAEGNVVKIADFGTAVRSGEVSGNARLEGTVPY
ncbi:kinase-like domain-containing protein, partial [Jimgerdemannia flammicorona]